MEGCGVGECEGEGVCAFEGKRAVKEIGGRVGGLGQAVGRCRCVRLIIRICVLGCFALDQTRSDREEFRTKYFTCNMTSL